MDVSFEELVGLLGAERVRCFALEKELISAREQNQFLIEKLNQTYENAKFEDRKKNPHLVEVEKDGRLEQSN